MMLELSLGNRLPQTLIIEPPAAHAINVTKGALARDSIIHHRSADSLFLYSDSRQMPPHEAGSPALANTTKQRSPQGGWRDQEEPGDVQKGSSTAPSSPSPSSPSSHRFWSIRRSVSAVAGANNTQSPTDSNYSSSPHGSQKRSSRISSFIKRHRSTPRLEDSVNRGLPSSLIPGIPPLQNQQRTYNTTIPQGLLINPPNRHTTTLSVPLEPPYEHLSSRTRHTFSPVSDNPFDTWTSINKPHTATPTPVAQMDNPLSDFLPTPSRGFSNSSAPAELSSATPEIIEPIDPSRAMESEPEGFTSPTEFALFAEATSSFSFLPSTFDTPSQLHPTMSISNTGTPTLRSQPLPPRHLIPLPQLITPRSRSVPASKTPIHHRSSSSTAAMPLPIRRNSPPYTYASTSTPMLQPPFSQPPFRSQLLADAIEAPEDEELPDYATSQAEASAKQRTEATRRARELEQSWIRGRQERARGKPWRAWDQGGY